MEPHETIQAIAFEDTDLALMARIRVDVNSVATYLTQSLIDTITYAVYVGGVLVTGGSGSITIATSVYNSLQANPPNTIWTVDKKGFNFKWVLPRTLIPDGAKSYYIPIKFKLLGSGYEFYVRYKIKTNSLNE